MALTAVRDTKMRASQGALTTDLYLPVAAATTIYQGALVSIAAAGFARPGRTNATDLVQGIAQETVVNAGADGAVSIRVKRCTAHIRNSGVDPVTAASAGRDCFIVDDEVVAATNNGGARCRAGRVMGLDAFGVWVETF